MEIKYQKQNIPSDKVLRGRNGRKVKGEFGDMYVGVVEV